MNPMRLMLVAMLCLSGCAVQRTVTITTRPPDATIKIRGIERGRGEITERLIFGENNEVIPITASRKGFQDRTISLTAANVQGTVQIDLKPHVRRVSITTSPVPAIISIDNVAVTPEPVSAFSTDVEFTVDANDNWISHVIKAERQGFVKSETTINWADTRSIYELKLEPMRKDVNITSNPPGATIYLDGEELGTAPVSVKNRVFEFDTLANSWVDHTVRVVKPGFDPIDRKINWDDGQNDYVIDMIPKQKTLLLRTDPPSAQVAIEGVTVNREGNTHVANLVYTPINDRGDLKSYKAVITHKGEGTEYHPAELNIPWDNGKTEYAVKLREVLSQPVPGAAAVMTRGGDGWSLMSAPMKTIGMKFTNEPQGSQPQQIVQLGKNETIGSISVSPDGQFLVYSVISAKPTEKGAEPTSQMFRTRTDGGGATALSDGRSIDLTPSFTAAGDRIVFASNRASRRFQIHAINAAGDGGVTRLTTSDSNDIWPSVDAEAKPRLFYQAQIDTRSDPRLYVTQIGTMLQTDLTTLGGSQPKVSPKNDSVIYVAANEKSGRRDIFRVSDAGGSAENLTNADADDTDPAWNFSGGQIAFASDRGKDGEDNRQNYDIWILDLSGGAAPKQITRNGSLDDLPAWDPSGEAIYFRSNRGGNWGIWKITVD
ncbi:MAG TPA: PEGA domain-containing protein [Tepidisphaeraceae bacterium]|jgi:Tol biopolymer transport system component